MRALTTILLLFCISTPVVANDFDVGGNCKNGICEIFRVTDNQTHHFNDSGIVPGSNGGVVIVDTSQKKVKIECWKAARVPKPIYRSIMKMMESLAPALEDPPPAFTPAQQTMLLFYNTIMQQTQNFNCAGQFNN
jgi:hypothetical protein